MAITITIQPKAASGPGALDGWELACTCGNVEGSSSKVLIDERRVAHMRWHDAQDAPRRKVARR